MARSRLSIYDWACGEVDRLVDLHNIRNVNYTSGESDATWSFTKTPCSLLLEQTTHGYRFSLCFTHVAVVTMDLSSHVEGINDQTLHELHWPMITCFTEMCLSLLQASRTS
ncbi:hypothetical protein COV06_03205 [Candidatus Uhrbacteria bacterium CG10_big_fil_rev_8_21_14_0_10_50_16]|uniref:Uncharacterized protein n=1 Tax=Candidatus Uhrbacteria bacterium CG10_big_fil_rev_8_21_14_0_10_50_16 TaxID=1975039 RepID=A0A2H0RLU9_9BACT|nr:MAG: hypothetical protein COV06_03205 [Candidatus Uhrbacteria bacterium CG10_big_fil_rev_8_21_14_0_10_50_16]